MPYAERKIGARAPEKLAPPEFFQWKKSPSKATLAPLLKHVSPVIDKALASYAGGMSDALRTRAKLMAVDYMGKYDPSKGMALNSYLLQGLQSLNRAKADRANVVHVPEGVLLDRGRIAKMETDFMSARGREPTALEIADETGLSVEAIERARRNRPFMAGSAASSEKGDSLFSKMPDYERVWSDFVYHDLDDRDKKIFEWTTGHGGANILPKGMIAQKLKISPAAVSLRINKIVAKLEEGTKAGYG